jgi:outer membrane protein assembly factor BamB
VIFDQKKKLTVRGDTGPLYQKVKYIFRSSVRVERCFIDGRHREGITAFSHPEGKLLWSSAAALRPAIKYTEVVGDIIEAGSGVVICQNFFSRKRRMSVGYSILCFDRKTGEILWRIESFTYSHRIYPFAVDDSAMYVTTGGHREGSFKKISLVDGTVLINEPFSNIDSGVAGSGGVFYFGAGGGVIACAVR